MKKNKQKTNGLSKKLLLAFLGALVAIVMAVSLNCWVFENFYKNRNR